MAGQRDTSNDIAMSREDLRQWMKTHDMSVEELAEMLGLTRQAVLYWVQGKRTIPEPIGRLLVFLGQRPEMFREF
jgi:transcriptional regulator with XRE-family HTH domain